MGALSCTLVNEVVDWSLCVRGERDKLTTSKSNFRQSKVC